jgi:hypothetical protein
MDLCGWVVVGGNSCFVTFAPRFLETVVVLVHLLSQVAVLHLQHVDLLLQIARQLLLQMAALCVFGRSILASTATATDPRILS